MRPYTQVKISDNVMLREFSGDVKGDELEWHMDRRDRRIRILESSGWKLQLESGLPFDMIVGQEYEIPKESWHRIIKGSGDLTIMIIES